MTNETKNIINDFKHFKNLSALNDYLLDIYEQVRQRLIYNNVALYDSSSHMVNEIVAGQIFRGEELINLVKFYEELTHIKKGLAGSWIHHIDESERYSEIQTLVEQITFKLT